MLEISLLQDWLNVVIVIKTSSNCLITIAWLLWEVDLTNQVIFLPCSQDESVARNLYSLALEDGISEMRVGESILQILDQTGLMQRTQF